MLGVLPEDVCSSLAQLVERALGDPIEAASSDALLDLQISALRCGLDDAISRVLTARNAKMLSAPDDIWPLVLDHLPLDDLLSASRTCRSLRTISLSHSRLWTRLILHVDECGSSSYSTNIGVLKNVLPRARDHLLELDVRVSLAGAVEEYDREIRDFLDLVAPRLVGLQMTSDVPRCVGRLLVECLRFLPELRELKAPPPSRGCSGKEEDCYIVILNGAFTPKLVDLDLHSDLRISCEGPWPKLRCLRCKIEGVMQLEDLFLSARGLRRLTLDWTYEWGNPTGVTPPRAALLAALRSLPDVNLTAELDPAFEDVVFDIFGRTPAPRLRLAFKICDAEYSGPFKPRPCSRLSSAVHLTISVRGDATVIVLDDDSDRDTLISLPSKNTLHPAIDWSLIPSFDALRRLSADAALWPDFMHNFPSCPRLAEITLAVRAASDMRAVLAAAAALPKAESLVLVPDPAIELLAEQVDALKTALGARHVVSNGGVATTCEATGHHVGPE